VLLSDQTICERIRSGDIQIVGPDGKPVINLDTGLEREPGQLQAHGYDLRVNRVFSWGSNRWIDLADGEHYSVKPGEFVIVGTYERLRLTRRVAATVHALARMTIAGLSHISTTIHPGWAEDEPDPLYLLVAVCNISRAPIRLERRQRFCRLLFWDVSAPATTAAPNLAIVAERFNRIRAVMQPRYSRANLIRMTGLIVGAVITAVAVIWLVAEHFPRLSHPATGIVVAMLTFAVGEVRRRYSREG